RNLQSRRRINRLSNKNMSIDRILKVSFQGKLVVGNGVLTQLVEDGVAQGYKAVVIMTIKPLLDQLADLTAVLEKNNIALQMDTSVEQEPSFSDVKSVLQQLSSFSADAVIGIGGGSVLDVAKIVAEIGRAHV